MKAIDCHAMGKLIEELLQQETPYPIAAIEEGYEEDSISTTTTPLSIGGICNQILVVTKNGQRFVISINRLNPPDPDYRDVLSEFPEVTLTRKTKG